MPTEFTRGYRWALALAAAAFACGCATTQAACDQRFSASPQAGPDCTFQNPPNPDALPSESSWNIWTRNFFGSKTGTVPLDPVPVRRLDRAALDALDPAANHVIRLGHASTLLKLRGRYWLVDPMFSERASPVQWAGPKRYSALPIALEQLPPIDGVVISHDHYDHLDAASIEYLAGRAQRFFVPLAVGERLRGMGVPAERIEQLDWWEKRRLGEVEVTATPAQHFSARTPFDRNHTLWASWVIVSGGERLFYSGDGGYQPAFKDIGARLGPFDAVLLENGAYDAYWPWVHMTPEEGMRAFADLRGKLLLPVHNSTFDLGFHPWREPMDRLSDLALKAGVALATPELGEPVTLGKPRSNVLWWKALR